MHAQNGLGATVIVYYGIYVYYSATADDNEGSLNQPVGILVGQYEACRQ